MKVPLKISLHVNKSKSYNTLPKNASIKPLIFLLFAMGIQGMSEDNRGVWLLINDAFTEITGYHPEEVIGHSTKDLLLYAHNEESNKANELFTKLGSVKEFEFEFHKKSGEIRHGMLWAEPIELDEEINALVLIQDITDRKRIEQERKALIDFQQIVAGLSARFINRRNRRNRTGD